MNNTDQTPLLMKPYILMWGHIVQRNKWGKCKVMKFKAKLAKDE